jgi:hypothetical protein
VIKLIRFTTGQNTQEQLRDPFIDAYLELLIIGSFVAGRTGRGPVKPVAGIGHKSNYEIILFMHTLNHQLLAASRAGRTGRSPIRPDTGNLESRRAGRSSLLGN